LTLFESTLIDNITLRRENLATEDLLWIWDLVGLQQKIDQFPDGLQTMVEYGGKNFSSSQTIQILLARSLITKPKLVILDGVLHEIPSPQQETILREISAVECSWTGIIVTMDSLSKRFVPHHIKRK